MKQIFYFIIFIGLTITSGCGTTSQKTDSSDSEYVEVEAYDRSIQSYIPDPTKASLNPESITWDDLVTSSRLLLTPGGVLKGLESGSGYQKVTSYTCEDTGTGWYFIRCKYLTSGRTEEWKCFVREKI